jgi:hypothetical protein
VAIGPGATALTRTPLGPYSSAQALMNDWITGNLGYLEALDIGINSL